MSKKKSSALKIRISVLLYFPILGTTSPNPFDLGDMGSTMPLTINNTGAKPKKSVNSLLGEHSNLVNLDNLVTDSKNQGEKFNYYSIFFM